jgi:hypothetical protein
MSERRLTDSHAAYRGLIGVARADITPPAGIYSRCWGAAPHDVADGVHRPLTCTALTLQPPEGGAPLVLVSLDLGWWRSREDELHVRGAVLAALGIDESRAIVGMAHTHAGPSTFRGDIDKPGGHLVAGYLDRVRDAAVGCARRALASAQLATLEWERGRCALARNRDLPDPAKDRVICGFNPEAPADDTLLVARAARDDGSIVATLVNYACHPTTLAWENRLISPDWVGAMRETVEGGTGGAPCLFLQGMCGELAPRDQYTGDAAIADANGRQVGYAALAALSSMLPPGRELAYAGTIESGAPLAAWKARPHRADPTLAVKELQVSLPLKDLASLAEMDASIAANSDRVLGERLRRKRAIRVLVGDGRETPVSVWAWRIGGALILAQPTEAYSWLQRELRRRLEGMPVACMNLANGPAGGYLPPRELYALDLYQVWQTPYGEGSLERFAEAAAEALRSLAPTAVTTTA